MKGIKREPLFVFLTSDCLRDGGTPIVRHGGRADRRVVRRGGRLRWGSSRLRGGRRVHGAGGYGQSRDRMPCGYKGVYSDPSLRSG